MKMAPKMAVVEREGKAVEVGIDEVALGDIFVVKPGESIPVDGVIVEGTTAVDESALTGESIPIDKSVNDVISAATMNQSGFIRARATRVGEDTTFSQIIQMVSDAAATKATIARIADKISGIFVPTIIGIAVLVTLGWLIAGRDFSHSLERGIAILVIACPCALGLATPVAVMVGNGLGAKNGILFKTSAALENAGRLQIVALDKTGTITAGKPEVTDIIPAQGVESEELIRLAYAIELKSEHPLAKSIIQYASEKKIEARQVSEFKVLAGNGLTGIVDGHQVYGGSNTFIKTLTSIDSNLQAKSDELANQGKTPLFFARDGKLLGMIAVADVIKEDSAQAVKELQNMGIEVVMLTGDNEKTAKTIGAQAGVDEVIAGVLPDGKEAVIRQLQKRGKVAMVGDGINDAPALTRADTGIAIGAGTDVAIDSADVVLMNSKLTDVSGAIRLSRATIRNIHENLFWAFGYNVILIPIAAGIIPKFQMNPMWGAAAMSISSFTVCMNALRLNLFHVHDASKDKKLKHRALSDQVAQSTEEKIEENKGEEKMKVKIEGMMCGHCEATVKKALEAIDGVESAEVSHEKNEALLTTSKDVPEDVIKAAVEAKDYKFCGIE